MSDKATSIKESYTCTACGRKNLKIQEIVYKEDENNQIDESTVTCRKCGLILLWPHFKKMVKPGREKEAEKLFKKMIENFGYNYNRRMIRRVLKEKKE